MQLRVTWWAVHEVRHEENLFLGKEHKNANIRGSSMSHGQD